MFLFKSILPRREANKKVRRTLARVLNTHLTAPFAREADLFRVVELLISKTYYCWTFVLAAATLLLRARAVFFVVFLFSLRNSSRMHGCPLLLRFSLL